MDTLPKSQLILGFEDFFDLELPGNRLKFITGLCKRNLIVELSGLNYRLKPKTSKFKDTSLKFQEKELFYFCGEVKELFEAYYKIFNSYKRSDYDYGLIFTRQTCLFALEEILQSDLKVIDGFIMNKIEYWDNLLKYILSINTAITEIAETKKDEVINFETLNSKMLPLNELSLESDPIYIPYRGHRFFQYLKLHPEISDHLDIYFDKTYSVSFSNFVYETLGMYYRNTTPGEDFDFFFNVELESQAIFKGLSQRYKSNDTQKLLDIRKYPFYNSATNEYILTDNVLLLEKSYYQFINDFWFDYIKNLKENNIPIFNIKKYKSIIGYFFENYVEEIIKYAFTKTSFYTIKCFDALKTRYNGSEFEIADLYIRFKSKIIIGQVKATSIYDEEKYSKDIDVFYKSDRAKFFKSFGVDQIVASVRILKQTIKDIDKDFPSDNRLTIFPVIVFNEKALQVPLMAKIFQDRFTELLNEFDHSEIDIYPLSLIHISDLENLQDYLYINPRTVWELLRFHCRNPQFMPPFFNTLNRKNIGPNYKRTMDLYKELIEKYQNPSVIRIDK